MNYGEFRDELQKAELSAYQESSGGLDYAQILVVDEEGFTHVVDDIQYDKETGAVWLRSSFRCDKEPV